MKISRMIKMHANEMVDINQANPGDIFAIFGVECSSGDTLTEGLFYIKINNININKFI